MCSSILPNSFRFLKIHSLPCFWSSYYYVLCFSSNVQFLVLGLQSFFLSNSKDTTPVCSKACNLFYQYSSNDKNVFLHSYWTLNSSRILLIPIERKGIHLPSPCLMFPILCETTRPLPLLPCSYLYTSQPKYFHLVIQNIYISN